MHGRTSTARDRACGSSNLLHRGAGEPRRRPSCRAGRGWTLRRACRPTTCRTRTSTSRAPRTWSCTGSDGCQTVVAGRVRYPVVLPAYDDALFHFLFSFFERKHINSITRTSTNQLCHPLLRPPKLNVVVPLHDTRLVLLNTRVVLTLANIDCHPAPMAHKTRVVDWKLVQSPTSG